MSYYVVTDFNGRVVSIHDTEGQALAYPTRVAWEVTAEYEIGDTVRPNTYADGDAIRLR